MISKMRCGFEKTFSVYTSIQIGPIAYRAYDDRHVKWPVKASVSVCGSRSEIHS